MKKFKIILIEWKDSTFYPGFYKYETVNQYGLKRMETIGFLIEETKEWIKVAQTNEITEENTISDFICIPKVNIIKKKHIRK